MEYIAHLLVVSAVQVAHLADQLGMDEAVGRYQMVRHCRLAVIHVRKDAYVTDAILRDHTAVVSSPCEQERSLCLQQDVIECAVRTTGLCLWR